jgi:hypothetical protein
MRLRHTRWWCDVEKRLKRRVEEHEEDEEWPSPASVPPLERARMHTSHVTHVICVRSPSLIYRFKCVCVFMSYLRTYATRAPAKVAFGPTEVLLLYARHMWVRPIGSSFPFKHSQASRVACVIWRLFLYVHTSVCTCVYKRLYKRVQACIQK